ncbi:MAG: acetylornithine/succinylornithine family transaminase [Acidobacteriota bacterium]|nr:acetylornithine/succinylornithine family transaminase [Acidobacteriota bacterium]
MTTETMGKVEALEMAHILPIYRRAPVVFERGEGVHLIDRDGRRYLDFVSGVGVAALGHAHPALAHALADQAATLVHTSNLYFHPLQGELAARLAAHSALPRAFFCNSGTEAVEACLKFARRFWTGEDGTPVRRTFVALQHSFHGRTTGSLSVTWDSHYRDPFGPLLTDIVFADPYDPASIAAAITDGTAAVIVEPIQGEGGVRPLSPDVVAVIAERCARTGALLIADEVQSGMGRTGQMFHSATLGLVPDLMALGKALGGGMPIGAALMSERVAQKAAHGDHGSTYGGNLLACRAGLTVLDELDGGLLAHVRATGEYFGERLNALKASHPRVSEVRGAGLMRGLDIEGDAAAVVAAALDRGLLVNRTAQTVLRLLPPYVATRGHIDEAMTILGDVL